MRKQISQNERQKNELDGLELNVLKSAAISPEELERIVSAPRVFDGVRACIRAEQVAINAVEAERANRRPMFAFLNWQYGAAAFASVLVLALAAYGVFLYAKMKDNERVADVVPKSAPAKAAEERSPAVVLPPAPQNAPDEEAFAAVEPEDREIRRNLSAMKTSSNFKPKRIRKEIEYAEPIREFYPVSYTNGDEVVSDVRIVRVELPRSSLLSMGVETPAHGGPETVKVELLVSADGVTKGIRLVD